MSYQSDEPCIVCNESREGMVCYHHLYTRGSHPELAETPWNKISVCQRHHGPNGATGENFHDTSTVRMADKFPKVKQWLLDHGWELLEVNGKRSWFHEKIE